MKAYKIEILVIDHENIGEDEIKAEIEGARYFNRCISPVVKTIVSKDIGDWDDEHPLNKHETANKEYERLFRNQSEEEVFLDEELIPIDDDVFEVPEEVSLEAFSEVPYQAIKLEKAPQNGLPPVYVTVFEGIGGWNSVIFEWNCEGDFGFYEPQNTGFNNTSIGTGLREGAVREAIDWAKSEELPYWIPEE